MPKKVFQTYDEGTIRVPDVPAPQVEDGHVLVRTHASLVSAGTERYVIDMARKSLVGKALERPDLVRKVIDKARTEGVTEAYRQAQGRLEEPQPLGYSAAGEVVDVGDGVDSLAVGDRVACTGSGYASHAELNRVPENLCAPLPDDLTFEEGAFAAIGGIALEGMRLGEPTLGEVWLVVGLGLIGQIAVQLLDASGCRIVGVDLDPDRCEQAEDWGAHLATTDYDEAAQAVDDLTAGHGADAALLAAATSSDEPLEEAAKMCRERGTVVATGLVGLDVPREIFYEKELGLEVSRAWGPGYYDPDYEQGLADYPYAHVRWTARRNVAAFLDQVARGDVAVDDLITHRFPVDEAPDAYEVILDDQEDALGVVMTYGEAEEPAPWTIPLGGGAAEPVDDGTLGIGVAGAGTFARSKIFPLLEDHPDVRLAGLCTSTGLSSRVTGDKAGFAYATTSFEELVADETVDAVMILTRHGSHADLASQALTQGVPTFVEKPLALTREGLEDVVAALRKAGDEAPQLMVGFNRRFSPFTRWLASRFEDVSGPFSMNMTVNAGDVPDDSWVYDPEEGGGRLRGEACHFVDLAQFLADGRPTRVHAATLDDPGSHPTDGLHLTLRFDDGSVASIVYSGHGDDGYPREQVEVLGGGAVGHIKDFKSATFSRDGNTDRNRNWLSMDRGHEAEVDAFVEAVRDGDPSPIPVEDLVWSTLATFAAETSYQEHRPVDIDASDLLG